MPSSGVLTLRDAEIRGYLGLVRGTGQRSWAVEYRPVNGGRRADTRRMKIGDFPAVREAEARKHAKRLLASVRLGADPARERQEQRATQTFDEVAKQLQDEACLPPRLKPHTARL